MPGQKRKIEDLHSSEEPSGFTPLLNSIFYGDENQPQQTIAETATNPVSDLNDSNQGIDIFHILANELGVAPVENVPEQHGPLLNNSNNDQKSEIVNVNTELDELEIALGLAPVPQSSTFNISTALSSQNLLQDLSNQPENLSLEYEEEVALRKDINTLLKENNKENFEKIISTNKNFFPWLRADQFEPLNLRFPIGEGYIWQVDLFVKALELQIDGKILVEWLSDNYSLINLLGYPDLNKRQGILLFNTLYTYIMHFTNKDLQDRDRQFLEYLVEVLPSASVLYQARIHLEHSKNNKNSATCAARINNLLSILVPKKPQNSIDAQLSNFNSNSNKETNSQTIIINDFQWLLLKDCESRLLKIENKEEFEIHWNKNSHILPWMRGTMIILSEKIAVQKINASTCLVIFQKMLKLKVDCVIVKAVLVNNSELVGILAKNSGIETNIIDYIYQLGSGDDVKNFAPFFETITSSSMLNSMLMHCDKLLNTYIPPEKIPALTYIKDLIIQQQSKLRQYLGSPPKGKTKRAKSSKTITNQSVDLPKNVNVSPVANSINQGIPQGPQIISLPPQMLVGLHTTTTPFNLFNLNIDTDNVPPSKLLNVDKAIIKQCIEVLRTTDNDKKFESTWRETPRLLELLRGERIYESTNLLYSVPDNSCLDVFKNMLKLKIGKSMIEAILDNNPKLVGKMNEPDALRHHMILDYILSQPFKDQAQLCRFFVDKLERITVLKAVEANCIHAAKKNQNDPNKLLTIRDFQDLLSNKIRKVEDELKTKSIPTGKI